MGNRQAKVTNQAIDAERGRVRGAYDPLVSGWKDVAGQQRGVNDSNLATLWQQHQDLLHGSDGAGGSISFGGGGGGGPDAQGWGRDEFRGLQPFIRSLGAPLSAADRARMGGGGVYEDFAKTGGLSEGDISNLRLRSSATGAAGYKSLAEQLATQNAAQGGFNPGYSAQGRQLARDQARSAAEAALGAETGIIDTRNQGRLAGAAGLAGTEGNIQNLLLQRILGAGGLQQAMASGLLSADQSEQSDARAREGLNLQGQGLELQRLLGALGGARDLAQLGVGREGQTESNLLNALGAEGGQIGANIGQRAAYNPNVSVWDRLGQLGGAAAGFITPFIGGGRGGQAPAAGGYAAQQAGGGFNWDPNAVRFNPSFRGSTAGLGGF